MSDKQKKRYYWLKLKEDFFEEDTIEWLEEQPNGKEYCLFYLKLCLKSLKTEGLLVRNVGNLMIPYDPESLAKLTNSNADTVKVAMDLFNKIGLIKILDGGEIYLNQLSELVGSETEYARQKRIQRAKEDNVQKLSGKGRLEKELEKELELEKEKELEKEEAAVANPFQIYQENFGVLSPLISEDINMWIEDIGAELVVEAMRRATVDQKSYRYAQGILRQWAKKNIDTMEKVKADDIRHESQTKSRHISKNVRREKLPDWVNQPTTEKKISSEKKAEIEQRFAEYFAKKEESSS